MKNTLTIILTGLILLIVGVFSGYKIGLNIGKKEVQIENAALIKQPEELIRTREMLNNTQRLYTNYTFYLSHRDSIDQKYKYALATVQSIDALIELSEKEEQTDMKVFTFYDRESEKFTNIQVVMAEKGLVWYVYPDAYLNSMIKTQSLFFRDQFKEE